VPLTDTHCHLNFHQFDKDRQHVINRAWEEGLDRILIPAIDAVSSREVVELAGSSPGLYAAVGVHPNSANTWERDTIKELYKLSSHSKVVAIGEIGLDYYRDRASYDIQKSIFREQLSLATQVDLPVVIHARNASETDRNCFYDVLEILTEWRIEFGNNANRSSDLVHPGVLHSYSGNETEGKRALELGFFIGITGPVTFKNSQALRNFVRTIPLTNVLIETDAPFLSPQPHRGKRNEPANVRYIAKEISEVLNMTFDDVADTTTNNADRLFRWREFD